MKALARVRVKSAPDWETGVSTPKTRFIPKIYDFLGYAPYQATPLLCQKIRLWRESLGLSQEQLAKQAGVDESSLATWERGSTKPTEHSKRTLETYFRRRYCNPIEPNYNL
jgi:DNA-binding XRE family transcriptional regulator